MESLKYFIKFKQQQRNSKKNYYRIRKISVGLVFCMLSGAILMCSKLAYAQADSNNILASKIEATETESTEAASLAEEKPSTPPTL